MELDPEEDIAILLECIKKSQVLPEVSTTSKRAEKRRLKLEKIMAKRKRQRELKAKALKRKAEKAKADEAAKAQEVEAQPKSAMKKRKAAKSDQDQDSQMHQRKRCDGLEDAHSGKVEGRKDKKSSTTHTTASTPNTETNNETAIIEESPRDAKSKKPIIHRQKHISSIDDEHSITIQVVAPKKRKRVTDATPDGERTSLTKKRKVAEEKSNRGRKVGAERKLRVSHTQS